MPAYSISRFWRVSVDLAQFFRVLSVLKAGRTSPVSIFRDVPCLASSSIVMCMEAGV